MSELSPDSRKGGNAKGMLAANDRNIEVLNGTIEGNRLTFSVKLIMQSQEISGVFEGRIKGDELEGNIEFKAGTRVPG